MNILKTMILALMLVIFSVSGLRAIELPSNDADNATLLQYALQLRETKPELFVGAQGVLILGVVPNSQAAKKGLQRGDIVIAYNGQQMKSTEQLSTIQANAAKQQVELQFIRTEIVQTVILQGGRIGIDLKNIDILLHQLDRLNKEAAQAYNATGYSTALEIWLMALEKARTLGDEHYVRMFLNNIGVAYRGLGQYQKALDYFQQALTIARKSIDKNGEEQALGNIGVVYLNLGQYQQALSSYQEAQIIAIEIGDEKGKGDNLSRIGIVYANLGQYQEALGYFQQALDIHKKLIDQREVGNDLGNIGMAYKELNQYQEALKYFWQAWVIHKILGDKIGEGNDLNNIGLVYSDLGQYQRALDCCYQPALAIYKAFEYKKGEGSVLSNIGLVYKNLSQYQKALVYHQQALKIRKKIGDKKGKGNDLNNIGSVYNLLGQYQKALDYYQQALEIKKQIEDKKGEGRTLNNIGVVYWNLDQYQRALYYYQQALEIRKNIKDKKGEGQTLNNIGVVHWKLGQLQQALVNHEQALAVYKGLKDEKGEGDSFGNIGLVHWISGEDQKALKNYQQALAIYQKIGDKNKEGISRGNIGLVYYWKGQPQKALLNLQQALEIRKQIGDKQGEGNDLGNIGFVYNSLGQNQEATKFLQEALTIKKDITIETISSSNIWQVQYGLALSKLKLNQVDDAIKHYKQALNNIDRLRAELTEKEYNLSFIQDKLFVYDEFIELLQTLHLNHPDKHYDRKTLEIFERKQARIFLEEMGKSGVRYYKDLPSRVREKENEIENGLIQVQKQLTEELAKPKKQQNSTRIQNLKTRKAQLNVSELELKQYIEKEHNDYYRLKYPKPVALETLQQDVLKADELMLIYNVREETTDLWVVGKEHFALFTLPLTEAQMQQQVTAFRDVGIESMLNEMEDAKKKRKEGVALKRHLKRAVRKTLPDFVTTSHAFYQQLLPKKVRELLTQAKPQTLYVVPTGALYRLPFEALVTVADKKTPRYLLQDYGIAYLSSASLLKTLRDAKNRRHISRRLPLLAFANPVFQQEKCDKGSGRTIRSLRTSAYRELLGDDDGCIRQLPATKDEALNIAKLFNVTPHSYPQALYLDEEASREKVLSLNKNKKLDDFRYVLFATHAVLLDELSYINQPAVLLSYPEKGGYLTMADVFELQMNADLVTLSACNTGRGDNIKGEGVRGLTRAFMYAGTPAVAVTLWEIHSGSSKALSVDFFSNKQQHALAKSLQKAKLAMLEGQHEKYYRHPYFWAGFVVFGDGR
ncbi:MAG: hypothetical protein DRR19_08995 [Candidatus Parabeggiatoa sp. nov. 1]|nr:MAG: hypothetical protein DRR19_08995 [Gammaproteobacteria bacterium]